MSASQWLAQELQYNDVRYLKIEKTTAWSKSLGLQLPPEIDQNSSLFSKSIPTEKDHVKKIFMYPEEYSVRDEKLSSTQKAARVFSKKGQCPQICA